MIRWRPSEDRLKPDSLAPTPFLGGYSDAAEKARGESKKRPKWLPESLAVAAQRAVQMIGVGHEETNMLLEAYGSEEYRLALRALTYDPWINNLTPDGDERPLELALRPRGDRDLRDDVPRPSMLVANTVVYRSANASNNLKRMRLKGGGEWLFMYDGWLVSCSDPVAYRGEDPQWQMYSMGQARDLGFVASSNRISELGTFTYPRVYPYRIGLPDDVSLQDLINAGKAVPSPLRYDLRKWPEEILRAYDMATPIEQQQPAVREAINDFITSSRQ